MHVPIDVTMRGRPGAAVSWCSGTCHQPLMPTGRQNTLHFQLCLKPESGPERWWPRARLSLPHPQRGEDVDEALRRPLHSCIGRASGLRNRNHTRVIALLVSFRPRSSQSTRRRMTRTSQLVQRAHVRYKSDNKIIELIVFLVVPAFAPNGAATGCIRRNHEENELRASTRFLLGEVQSVAQWIPAIAFE